MSAEEKSRKYLITSERLQILNLLLSACEAAVQKDQELSKAQEQLRMLNEQLEQRLRERTAALIEEITERKKTEDALRQSEEKYRSLVDNVKLGIFRSTPGPAGRFLEVNKAMEEITGYAREELLRMDVSSLYVHPEKREEVIKEFSSVQGKVTKELNFRKKDGTKIVVADTKAPIRDGAGKIIYFDGILEDITMQKKMDEQLIVTDRLASIGALASGIAHEMNNPLTSVVGFSYLLLKRDLPDDVKKDLKTVNAEARRIAQVVKGLLAFARRQKNEKELVNISSIIQAVLKLRTYEQKVNNIEVISHFAPALPQTLANVFQLQQVFFNLVINAEYFMNEAHGRGTLTITTERVGDIVRAIFTDDGPGISQENMRHLFTPFFTTKEVGKGTGLGLSICHGIVTAHGGRIYAESEPGKGATFIVELPISK